MLATGEKDNVKIAGLPLPLLIFCCMPSTRTDHPMIFYDKHGNPKLQSRPIARGQMFTLYILTILAGHPAANAPAGIVRHANEVAVS